MSEFVRIIDPSGKTIRNDLYNSPPDAASYIIFKDGGLIKAKNGRTGQIEFSGSDAATVIQSAIDALKKPYGDIYRMDGKIFIKAGAYGLTKPLNLTNTWFAHIEGEGFGLSNSPTRLHADNPEMMIDLTGGRYATIRNLSFEPGTETPKAYVLMARASDGASTGNHLFERVMFRGDANYALVYIFGSEVNEFKNCCFNAVRRGLLISGTNIESITSPYTEIYSGRTSTNENDFIKCVFTHEVGSQAGEVVLIGPRTWEARFFLCCFNEGNNDYAVKLKPQSGSGYEIRNLQFLSCHLENGGLITSEVPDATTYLHGLVIRDCLISAVNMPAGNIVVDLNKSGLVIQKLLIDELTFCNPGAVLEFYGTPNGYIRLPASNQPTLNIVNFSWTHLDVYNPTKVNITSKFEGYTLIYRREGYLSYNRGTATIPAGSTSVTVNHGLADTPSKVLVTPIGDPGDRFWVANITSTSFDIVVATAPAADIRFYWQAEVD